MSTLTIAGRDYRTAPCRSCGAPVVWVRWPSGRRCPLDAQPRPDGNIVVDADGVAGYVPADDAAWDPRFVSHVASCAISRDWRRAPRPQETR